MDKRLSTRFSGTRFAVTAAALFLTGCGKEQPTTTPTDGAGTPTASGGDAGATAEAAGGGGAGAGGEWFGIKECSGQGGCDVAGSHDCGGQNSCRGKGWILVPQSECDEKGGKVL